MNRAEKIANDWETNPRWSGIRREYSAEDVVRMSGSEHAAVEYTRARKGAERFWELLHERPYVSALGALSGGQAVQMVRAGLEAIYLSGWQVAADANCAGETYPDQSLYPYNSVPSVVRRINNAFKRADQIDFLEGNTERYWFAPIVADAEAGFGGEHTAAELMGMMIEAGAAGVHYEDQLASEKKCGHLGGKVLVPIKQFVKILRAARFEADKRGVSTIIVGRTDADSAKLITNDVDERDLPYIDKTFARTDEGFYHYRGGLEAAITRAVAYAPYADLLWCETSTPNLDEAKQFAEGVHREFPGKMLAYNCSPSFNWKKHLDDATIAKFQRELGAMGYTFQFITLAGFHALNQSMFELALDYQREGMPGYVRLQEEEFALEKEGYTAVRHQREVGTGVFDAQKEVLSGGKSATTAMGGSTEEAQFRKQ